MKSDGSAIRNFCYIADSILSFFYMLFKGKNGGPYNIGNEDVESSIRHLASIIGDLSQKKDLGLK